MTKKSLKNEHKEKLIIPPLQELNSEIYHCNFGYEQSGTSQSRKAFFKRLVTLEKIREQAYEIPAKKRRFGES